MANIKTAVSLDATLFAQAEQAAHEMNLSRSSLFALALEEFLQQRRKQQLVEQINASLEESGDDDEERAWREAMRRQQRELIERSERERL